MRYEYLVFWVGSEGQRIVEFRADSFSEAADWATACMSETGVTLRIAEEPVDPEEDDIPTEEFERPDLLQAVRRFSAAWAF